MTKQREKKEPLIIIASNRGPFSFTAKEDGTFDLKRGAGGLVTALAGLAEQHDVTWVATSLGEDDCKWAEAGNNQAQSVENIALRLIIPDAEAYKKYYEIIANPLLWFIQHQLWDMPRYPSITKETWDAWENGYVVMNQLFADVIAEMLTEIDRPVIILPQDYHLYLLPRFLRNKLGDQVQIQPFIHIPWPGPDAWSILPTQMRDGMLDGLLASDRVGFQTRKDAFNFVQTSRYYLKDAHSYGSRDSLVYEGRKIEAKTYPISIDVDKVLGIAQSDESFLVRTNLLNSFGVRKIILRIDRIEPSKNILRGLEAFRVLLENHPEYHGKVHLLALLVPSRMEVSEYQSYMGDIMVAAGTINATYSEAFWEPVRIIVGDNYTRAIAAMQLYHVLLVNPVTDGMNLVAKEGVLVNERDGVLVLSEHAGAFFELGDHALTVSPFDVYGTAEAIHQALAMPVEERHARAEALREQVKQADIKQWFDNQIQDALAASSSQRKKAETSDVPVASASA